MKWLNVRQTVLLAAGIALALLVAIVGAACSRGGSLTEASFQISCGEFRQEPHQTGSIDLAEDTLAIMAHALSGIKFRPENIDLGDELYAAERANELVVEEGIPFREAYQRIAADLKRQSE